MWRFHSRQSVTSDYFGVLRDDISAQNGRLTGFDVKSITIVDGKTPEDQGLCRWLWGKNRGFVLKKRY